jgi:O-antigen ligase
MVEIIAIWMLAKKNSRIAKEKGYTGFWFALLTIFSWVFFEICGIIIAGILFGESLVVYLIGILSAILGGVISHIVVRVLKNKNGFMENQININDENIIEYSEFENQERK